MKLCVITYNASLIWFSKTSKSKVKFTLEQAMQAQIYSFTLPSTLALDGDGWSTPRPGRFTPGKDPDPLYRRLGGP